VPLPHDLFGFVGMQADTETGTAVAGAPDQTISEYEQEKRGVSAACASTWVFVAHNYPPMHPGRCILCSKPAGETLVEVWVLDRFQP
jgi:hypothetical protein